MIIQAVRMALKSIFANKTRAFLTMLGIIIGVLSLVVLVSLVTSATSSVEDQISSIGNDRISVSVMDDKGNPLKASDLDDIAKDDSIALIAPVYQSQGTVRSGTETVSVSVTGTSNSYFYIDGLAVDGAMESGRLLLSADSKNVSLVTVLTYETAEKLYGNTAAAVGQTMTMDGLKYLVVGVLEKDESMMSGMMSGRYTVYIPFTVAERISESGNAVSSFYVSAKDADSAERAQATLETVLTARFNGDSDAFYVMSMNSIADAMSNVTNIFALLLGGLAAISLLVGGIGIMNIMLVSVTERTREIGIRKAIGARRGSIMSQFLIESLVICLMGCAIGIALSGIVLFIVDNMVDSMSFTFSGMVVLIAVAFSTFIGLVFGIYPAHKAAKMHPIDALRYE